MSDSTDGSAAMELWRSVFKGAGLRPSYPEEHSGDPVCFFCQPHLDFMPHEDNCEWELARKLLGLKWNGCAWIGPKMTLVIGEPGDIYIGESRDG